MTSTTPLDTRLSICYHPRMATKLNDHTFRGRGGGRTSKYPWATWLDGSIWSLEAGKDYDGKTRSLTSAAAGHAKKLGLKLRTEVSETGVILQAYRDNGQNVTDTPQGDVNPDPEDEN